jgi:multiple sugar transport system substrate-binding protein
MCIFNKEDPQEVLASWLFMQYMLTDKVQIAYSQTEGYLPVTTKAQNNPEYLDYLSRAGEDNDLYYDVKIAASKLLQDNIDNTFVTPVFNGSASLRDAAGQMIENTTKSVRRKETVDEAYMEKLFADVTALYRLDQIQQTDVQQDLGPLPAQSVILLVTLAVIWVIMGLYVVKETINKKKVRKT